MGHEKKKWTAFVVAVLIIVVTAVVAAVHNRDVELDSYWVRNPAKFCSGYSSYAVMDPARCYDFEEFYEDFVGAGGREAVAPSGTQVRRPAATRVRGVSTTGTAMTGTWRDILRFVKIDVCSERNASEETAGAAGYDEQWIARKDFIVEPLYCMANGDKVTVRITFDLDGLRAAYPDARKLSGENVLTKAYTISGLKTPTVVDPFAMLSHVSVDSNGNLVYSWKSTILPCGRYFLKHADYTNFDLLDGNGKIVESNVVVFGSGSGAGAGGGKPHHWKVGDRVLVTVGTTATHYLRDYGIVVKPVEKVFVVQK